MTPGFRRIDLQRQVAKMIAPHTRHIAEISAAARSSGNLAQCRFSVDDVVPSLELTDLGLMPHNPTYATMLEGLLRPHDGRNLKGTRLPASAVGNERA